ncbi:ATP-binding protein [Candidatus Pacearchaeota archaeon]|nr:ATP-binding protein [Candidatus Pacearchaeota archaeon]
MIYKRKLLDKIIERIDNKEIIVVTGMRRVGKTTLFKMVYEHIKNTNKVFLDLDNPLNQKIFEEEDYNNIWANLAPFGISNKGKAFIFLDEIQAKPEAIKAVKYLYDHYDVKFFLTGSSSFYLKNLFPESLAGRKIIFELFPLDFEEFLLFKGQIKKFYIKFSQKDKNKNKIEYERIKKLYEEYIEFGGFPQVVLESVYERKKEILIDIFRSYFEKDVLGLADFKEINKFRDLSLLLLKRVGAKLDISKLSSELGVSRETIYSYISFLEKTYFLKLISPFTKSIDREISGTKKIYICDNGIGKYIGKCEDGNLFENAVLNNLKNYGEIKYYERRIGGEIDFILSEQNIALEAKNKGNIKDYLKLKKLSDSLGIKECYIISKEFINEKGFIISTDL